MCMMPALAFAQAVLPTSWSFINPSPEGATVADPTGPEKTYATKAGWSTKLDVFVTGATPFSYATGSDGNVAGRLDAAGEYIKINIADQADSAIYYLRAWVGGTPAPTAFNGEFRLQESTDGTNWVTTKAFTSGSMPINSYARNASKLLASTRFIRFIFETKVSGINVGIDNVTITQAPAPSLGFSIKNNTTTLVNNNTFVFGNAASQPFTILNIGDADNLKIDSIKLTGANASDFSVGSFNNTIAPNATETFSVNFAPPANAGSRFASMIVYSNDAARSPFTINLYAISGTKATEPINQISQVTLDNVKTYAMNVRFGRSAGAEKYILLRKTGNAITEAPVDGVTYKRGDYIGGAQVAYIGTDSTLIKPTYILANTSYSFAAFPFNGPDGYENYNTTTAPTATATSLANEIGSYYASVNPVLPDFITTLAARIRNPHDTVFYGNYTATLVNNFLTRDTAAGKKIVNCVYTGIGYMYEEPFVWKSGSNSGILSREHTFAQSWMPTKTTLPNFPEVGGREVLEYNDLHHLFPADQDNANGVRSNLPFGVVVNVSTVSSTGFGKRGTDSRGTVVYEPKDDQKGNLARALFYMLVRYNGERGNQWRLLGTQDINVLLQWHQQDPPDALEIARNEYIASLQHNRNPFIDNPQWVNRINFSNMTYIADPNSPSITVTAPAANATVIAGKTAVISWTSANVDSVLVELKTTAMGPYKTVGKYAASLGSVNYRFNENPTAAATVRVSQVSTPSVNALSGDFNIMKSSIRITQPSNDSTYIVGSSSNVIKWTKTFTDSVDVILYRFNAATQDIDTLKAGSNLTTDSVTFSANGYDTIWIEVVEKSADKSAAYMASDRIRIFVKAKLIEGLAENNALNDKVTVYPVPSNGSVNVLISSGIAVQTINAYDVTGRLVETTSHNNLTLPGKGLYILHIITDKGMAVKKVVVE